MSSIKELEERLDKIEIKHLEEELYIFTEKINSEYKSKGIKITYSVGFYPTVYIFDTTRKRNTYDFSNYLIKQKDYSCFPHNQIDELTNVIKDKENIINTIKSYLYDKQKNNKER